MVLTERQAQAIKEKGMPCFATVKKRAASTLALTLDPGDHPRTALNGNLLKDLDWHVQAHTGGLLSMSVASLEYASVAKSATHFSSYEGVRDLGGKKALYLFRMKVPELSLVRHTGEIARRVLGKFRNNTLENTHKPAETYKVREHAGLEMWTYFGVPKESIISVEKQTGTPVKYDFKGRSGLF